MQELYDKRVKNIDKSTPEKDTKIGDDIEKLFKSIKILMHNYNTEKQSMPNLMSKFDEQILSIIK